MDFFNYLHSKPLSAQTQFLFAGQEDVLFSFFSGLIFSFLEVKPQWVFSKNAFFNLKDLQHELEIKSSVPGRNKATAAQSVTTGLLDLARLFSNNYRGTSAVASASNSAVFAFLPGGNFLSQCSDFSRSCHTLALKVLLQATFILSCARPRSARPFGRFPCNTYARKHFPTRNKRPVAAGLSRRHRSVSERTIVALRWTRKNAIGQTMSLNMTANDRLLNPTWLTQTRIPIAATTVTKGWKKQ
jgi:hypothetical protein